MRNGLSRWMIVALALGASCRCSRAATRRVAALVRNDTPAEALPAEPPPTSPDAPPTVGGCPVFPADHPWNRDVSNDPVDPRSAAYLANIAAHGPMQLHADFGPAARHGVPYRVVPASQPMVPVTFDECAEESDPGPYPIPADPPIEAGRDRHVLIVQQGTCMLYELYHVRRTPLGWKAGTGAVFNLREHPRRPRAWTSAEQGGMAILAGLARYPEVAAGRIRHALRVTFNHTQDGWIEPANHYGDGDDRDAPPMGLRLRLKASYDLSRVTGQTRVILEALKHYGLIVADTGTNWHITGAPDSRWDLDDLDQLVDVPGTAFEVVQTGPVQHR